MSGRLCRVILTGERHETTDKPDACREKISRRCCAAAERRQAEAESAQAGTLSLTGLVHRSNRSARAGQQRSAREGGAAAADYTVASATPRR